MYLAVLNPSCATRISRQTALATAITTLSLLLVSEKPGAAQVSVSGVIPGFGTVTRYRNEPDFLELQVKGGPWPRNPDSRQDAILSFTGAWTGQVRLFGYWGARGSRLDIFSSIRHSDGPLFGTSINIPAQLIGPEGFLSTLNRTEHDSVYDYESHTGVFWNQAAGQGFDVGEYTWTLTTNHGETFAFPPPPSSAPEPGTVAFLLPGAIALLGGYAARRRV